MKIKLFISYSDDNRDKVRLIKNELQNHPTFLPIIVAFNPEPNKALTRKVIEGINSCHAVVPILTRRSISKQWINQEIGFSIGTNKSVYPIVEDKILSDLKGFIHKQNDIPFVFSGNESKGQENKSFINIFRLLLKKLESENVNNPLLLIDKRKKERKFKLQNQKFLHSKEGIEIIKKDFLVIIDLLNNLKKEYKKRGLNAQLEIDGNDTPTRSKMAFMSTKFSVKECSFMVNLTFYKTQSHHLYVWYYLRSKIVENKNFLSDTSQFFIPEEYADSKLQWLNVNKQALVNNSEIVDLCSRKFTDMLVRFHF